jgi:hypothetical protein
MQTILITKNYELNHYHTHNVNQIHLITIITIMVLILL